MIGIAWVSGEPLEMAGRVPAVDHRQAEVHQNQIRALALGGSDPLLAVMGDDHLEALSLEPSAQHVDVVFVVLDVQNLSHRAALMPRVWVRRRADQLVQLGEQRLAAGVTLMQHLQHRAV